MKPLVASALFALLLGATAPLAGAPPETLTLTDLANHPERWPARIAVPEEIKFQDGTVVKKGQLVRVLDLKGSTVVVDAGNDFVFDLPVAKTALLAEANKAWAALPAAQRAVDVDALLADPSLWPARATSQSGFTLNNGSSLKPGGEYELVSVDRDGVKLFAPDQRMTLVVDLAATDVIARARLRADLPPEKRPSRVAAALAGKLVDGKGGAVAPSVLDEAQVFALYYGANWCPPCRAFSPDLVKFANEVSAANPKLAVVLLSNDRSDAEMSTYMQGEKMPWPALPLAALQRSGLFLGYAKGSIPQLVIVDRHGRVLADSYRGRQYVGPHVPLKALAKLLETGVAR